MTPRSSEKLSDLSPDEKALRLIQLAARLMVEYNVRSSTIIAKIRSLANRFDLPLQSCVTDRAVNIYLSDGRTIHVQAPEYRLNVAISSGVLQLMDAIAEGRLNTSQAIEQLQSLETANPCHGRWATILCFGVAAAALAGILQADFGTMITVGVSSALGLWVRRELGKRHWPLYFLPFTAAAIGGVIAGWAIKFAWTETSGLCLVVPALMLVPGPHLINGHFDILENHIQPGLCRLVLAAGILMAAALGALVGAWAIIDLRTLTGATADDIQLTLWLDLLLSGMAACGFGIFYNSPWRVLWISIVCGMVGHGARYLCLAADCSLPFSTFLASTTIGVLAGIAVIRLRLSFSSIAFAAAVPMMPGTLIYRSFAGAVALASAGKDSSATQLTSTVVLLLEASLVIAGMVFGLLLGAFIASLVASAFERLSSRGLPNDHC